MYEQPPPQVPPIDRKVGYEAYLKVYKETVDVGDERNAAVSPARTMVGFTGGPRPTAALGLAMKQNAAPADRTTILIMDGPGGLFGPSFADPAPWACGGAPTPGCLPPPPPAIGGLY
ncbi:hypothetical protein ABZW03_39815 [Kitasatospora sp. NPDC004799]|uniref:hypothetical protein n=1 Tax=Kitasatospora sp. NPDC004799 TaxID=3154460 RepID=UPI0033B84B55